MKTAFEAQLLLDENKTGIGWLAHNVASSMKNMASDNEYTMNFFLLSKKRKRHEKAIDEYKKMGFKINSCKWFNYVIYKMLWSFIPVAYSLFFGKKADATVFFNYYIPPGVKGKKVTMIHDMTYKVFPETVNKKTLYMLNMNMKKSCQRADKIITISQFSKLEIMKYMKVEESRIAVMPVGVKHEIFRVCEEKGKIKAVTHKYGIDGEYFLYLGTLEPRKNIERMIDAYAKLKSEVPSAPKFVLAGRKGWLYDTIFEKVKKYNLEDSVIFTGYVEAFEAPLLMNGALAFMFVSLYEGFGMPALEAMACGTAVITANAASLPEVVGDCALVVDPYSVEDISWAMKMVFENNVLREELIKKGLKRSESFTWEKSAKAVLEVIENL